MPDTKGDMTPAVLGIAAVGMIGLGVYLWSKKPGVQPGAEMFAIFKCKHIGDAGDYYFQVALGHIRLVIFFDEVEGLKWKTEEHVEAHANWTEIITRVEFTLPEMMNAGEYDAEATIRTMDDKVVARVLQKAAVLVPKP